MGSGSACVCSTRGSSKNKDQKDPKLDHYMTFLHKYRICYIVKYKSVF